MNSSTQVNNVFDYFAVCGLDSMRGLVPNNEHNVLSGPLEATYHPQVLAHYPENVAWNPFDGSAVTTLCMPSGVHFSCVPKESHDTNKEPHFHPFIITKENGSKVYGFSLVFYEEVVDDSIINAISSLQKMHAAQIVEIAPRSNLEVFEDQTTCSKSLPRHFKVNSTRLYDKAKSTAKFDVLRDCLLVAKCVCLIGQYPVVDAARNFLINFYRLAVHSSELSTLGDHPLSMLSPESYIYYLLFSVPLPSPNQCIVIPNVPVLEWTQSSTITSSTLIFQRPSVQSELPLFEYEIGQVIDLLGIDHLIQLWTCLLLESQVLIHSHDFSRLMLVAESLTTLLFPFCWPHVYVPILPAAMYNFLDAPVPFVMGLRSLPSDDARIPSEANLCMVDIDNDRITIPEDLPSFPQHKELADELREVLTKLQQNSSTTGSSSTYKKPVPRATMQSSSSSKQRQSWSPMALASGSNASVLERSEAFQRISAIAKRTGVFNEDTKTGSINGDMEKSPVTVTGDLERYLRVQILNNAIREIFLNQFAHMFSVYEYFFNQPNQDLDSWLSNRDQVHPFDKTTFLSDQPGPHLRFMSSFLESQMFASFIDTKVLANYGQYSHSVRVLDARIKLLKDGYGDSMVRTPGYEPCTWYEQTAALVERRLLKPSLNVVTPNEILTNMDERPITKKQRTNNFYPGFPVLNNSMLSTAPCNEATGKKGEKLRRKEKPTLQKSYSIGFESSGIAETIRDSNNLVPAVPIVPRPAVIAQGNWKFVEQLLQECKTKTKRLLVGKMGSEAFELGHGQVSVSGVEDNTLIAGLCDLLERVCAHGLQTKQGKSALWSHILHYHDLKTAPTVNKPVKASSQAPAYAFVTLRKRLRNLSAPSYEGDGAASRSRSSHSVDSNRTGNLPNRMKPLPESLIFDMRNVQNMTEIKTHLGYARAWVRLCLEKKLLYVHLTTLLSEENLLRTLYKRYAFLRCEDERNLFLTYLLTLNAADYHSFTHTYTSTVITYRVLIVQTRQSNMSTCRPYLLLSGTLADTQALDFANDRLELLFQHKNLGILTTLRIGLEDQIGNSRWLIDHIIVRNETTGRGFKFPCGRWLGKDIEDGSTERLLVATPYDCSTMSGSELGSIDPSMHVNGSPAHNSNGPVGSRTRSPSATRTENSLTSSLTNLAGNLNINLKGAGTRRKFTENEMQCLLGEAVNNLIKYYLEPTGERGNVTALLCGESGLVPCLELVLHHGFRSSRIFSRNLFLWDYLLQVHDCYKQDPRSVTSVRDYADPSCDRPARRWLCEIIGKIQRYGHSLGKRDKLQLFLCLAARDRMLHRIISPLASCSSTLTHYDENSYLRDKRLRDYLQPLLQTLSEEKVNIILEASITRGID